MELDQDACYRAVVARDARFDGRFFTGVLSTGIYCRPVCPARTPKRENVRFFCSAAAAEEAGLRACLRCRPETAPDFAGWRGEAPRGGAWQGTANTVSRGLALIEQGALDAGGVEALAGRLGVGERQLRRLFLKHLGAAPVSVAQTRRLLLAKQLIHETDLSMAEVALASGFGSVRRFNETFQKLYDRPPSALRRRALRAEAGEGIRLNLAFRPPYDWAAMLTALSARADPAERVEGGRWVRRLEGGGQVTVERADGDRLRVTAMLAQVSDLPGVLSRVRRVFDLAADPAAIAAHLSADPALKSLVEQRPGLRLVGEWEAAPGRDDPGDCFHEDRFHDDDPRLAARAECWRPWRAYAAAHLAAAGVDLMRLITDGEKQNAA